MILGHIPALPCLLLLSLLGPSSGLEDDRMTVLTTSGPIRGTRLSVGSDTVTAFLGIPYAEPPVGALRFQRPLPHQPWSDILEATGFGNACMQCQLTHYPMAKEWMAAVPQSEDCLFLNIWVPHPQPPIPVPIVVWIYGGGFFVGGTSAAVHDGHFLAASRNVIVASMNYRLGALGFLSLPPAAPGNAGLWDQRLALHWLSENAAAFGGNPAQLLLFGHDAGAASVGFHLLSPGSRPFITRAMLFGGVPNAAWAWISLEEAQKRGRALGQLLNCTGSNDTDLVVCLQGKEPRELLKHQFSVSSQKQLKRLLFLPTPDGDFLPDTPPRLLQARDGQPIPIVVGFTADEGAYSLYYIDPDLNLANASNFGWEELLQTVRLLVPRAPEEAIQAVAEQYSQEGMGHGNARYLWAASHISGDFFFVCPGAELARIEEEAGSLVYGYYFTHRTSGLPTPEWTGVPHGSEVPYLFGTLAAATKANHTHTLAENMMSRSIQWYCEEFASTGNLTGVVNRGQRWQPYNSTEENFFHIGLGPLEAEETSPTRHCSSLALLLGGTSSPLGSPLPFGSGPNAAQSELITTAVNPTDCDPNS